MKTRMIVKAKSLSQRRSYWHEVLMDRDSQNAAISESGVFMARRVVWNQWGVRVMRATFVRFEAIEEASLVQF